MAEYVPVFEPTTKVTKTVGATAVVGGNLVELSTAQTVIPSAGATADWLGIATTDGATGQKVGIVSGSEQELVASAAIAVGDTLIPDTAGRVAPIGAGTNYAQVVGVALTAAGSAGIAVRVQMAR